MQAPHIPMLGQKRPAEQLPSIDTIMAPLKRNANINGNRVLPPPYNILPPIENVLSTPPLLKRILSFVLSYDELNARNVVIRAKEGVTIMYSEAKLGILNVCKRWRYVVIIILLSYTIRLCDNSSTPEVICYAQVYHFTLPNCW